MTLSLAMRYSNCAKDPHANNVMGFGAALMDDVHVLKYRKMKVHLYIIPKKYAKAGITSIVLTPMVPKREKRRKHSPKSRNRRYTKSNMNLLERRRFINAAKG